MAFATRMLNNRTVPTAGVSRRSVVVRAEVDTKKVEKTQNTVQERTNMPSAPERVQAQETGKQWMLQQPGITAPTGFFDPFGFTNSEQFSVGEGKRFRESELTHGRVAMLAALGWIVQEQFHPLFGGQIGGPAFVHFQKVEKVWPQFWEIILLGIGISEAYRIGVSYNDPRLEEQIKGNHMPGNLGFDPLALYPKDPKAQFEIRTKELNNGRLAMIAVAGFAGQEERDHRTILRGLFPSGLDAAPPPPLPPY